MKITGYVMLMRPHQYYKNLVIFLALFFSGNFFNLSMFWKTLEGFVVLCLVSSSAYVLNDIIDLKKDRVHPEKSRRPLASGSISVGQGLLLFLLLLIISVSMAFLVGYYFLEVMLLLLLSSFMYSAAMSRMMFLDVIFISVNFVLRSVSGGVINGIWLSPWLLTGTFFLAFFLAVGKRRSENAYLSGLGKNAGIYPGQMLDFMLYFSATILTICYVMYAVFASVGLIITIPLIVYMIFAYMHHAWSGSKMARYHELLILDRKMAACLLIYGILLVLITYSKGMDVIFSGL